MKFIIIGNGPAAVSAVEAIRTFQKMVGSPDVEILMFSNEGTPAYAPMFLTEYVVGKLEEKQLYLRNNDFYDQLRIKTYFGEPVNQIDYKNKKIILKRKGEFDFDRLLIATGAVAIQPPLKGIHGNHVFVLSKLGDAKKLVPKLTTCKKAVVMGAGAIGIEAATALNSVGLDVTLIEVLDQVAPTVLDKEGARFVEASLRLKGINLILGKKISEIFCNRSSKGCILEDGKIIESDLIVVCVGVKPVMDVVKSTGMKVRKGLVVNEKMETSLPSIYAAGDVTESRNLYGKYALNFTWYSAVEQGWVAGCNMIGVERWLTQSVCLNVLKGLHFVSAAISQMPPRLDGCEVLTNEIRQQGIFEKIILNKGRIIQYQGVKTSAEKIGFMYQAIKNGRNIEKYKPHFFKTDFGAAYLL